MTSFLHLHQEHELSEHTSEGFGNESDRRGKKHSEPTLDQTLANQETKAVNCLRLVTFLILVGAAILVSVAVYLIVKHDEEDTFEEQFNDLAFRLGTYQTLILLLCKWLS
jgi:hypothetical protein